MISKKIIAQSLMLGAILLLPFGSANADGFSSFGGALSFPQSAGDTKSAINDGFGFNLNYTYQVVDKPYGFRIDGLHANFGLTNNTLDRVAGSNDGYADVWGGGVSFYVSPSEQKKVQPYAFFGPGIYYQHAVANRTNYVPGYVWDPWWGYVPTMVPASVNLVDKSSTKLGWQGGFGLGLNFDTGGSFYMELMYVSIPNGTDAATQFMPFNIGYRYNF